MNTTINQTKEKHWFRKFIESPITIFIIGLGTLALVSYIIVRMSANHKETMFAISDIVKMIPSIKV